MALILTSRSSSFLNCIKSSNEARCRDMFVESQGGICLSLSSNASIVSKHNVVTNLPNMYM